MYNINTYCRSSLCIILISNRSNISSRFPDPDRVVVCRATNPTQNRHLDILDHTLEHLTVRRQWPNLSMDFRQWASHPQIVVILWSYPGISGNKNQQLVSPTNLPNLSNLVVSVYPFSLVPNPCHLGDEKSTFLGTVLWEAAGRMGQISFRVSLKTNKPAPAFKSMTWLYQSSYSHLVGGLNPSEQY